jgi:hypothetical protein
MSCEIKRISIPIERESQPAPDAPFVRKVLVAEDALQVGFLASDDSELDHKEDDGEKEKWPDCIGPKSHSDIDQ